RAYGLVGPLVAAVRLGIVTLDEAELERLGARHEAEMEWCLLVERRLLDIEEVFDRIGGVDHRVLKGPAVAHLDEPDPSLRSFGDLDILIAAHDMDRGIAALETLGAERRLPERRPGFDRRFVKGVGMACDDGVEIDVHRSLCGGPHGFRIPLDRLFAEERVFDVGGRPIPALSDRHRALHACYHAVIGSAVPPLRTLRDLAGFLTLGEPVEDLVGEARRWRGEAVLAAAVGLTVDVFDLVLPEWTDWVERFGMSDTEADIIRRARREPTGIVEPGVLAELSWPERAAFLFAVAFPSKAVLAERGQTPLGRITSGLRRMRGDRTTDRDG
ncbi:MAG: nucleotidyltransferase family protein, partial [Acidimicrobiales bacterium]|nr:nucleotidyltransferase family protein [Acidimicrobiales bacterium]